MMGRNNDNWLGDKLACTVPIYRDSIIINWITCAQLEVVGIELSLAKPLSQLYRLALNEVEPIGFLTTELSAEAIGEAMYELRGHCGLGHISRNICLRFAHLTHLVQQISVVCEALGNSWSAEEEFEFVNS